MKIKQLYKAFVRGVFGHTDEHKNVAAMSDIDVLMRAHELFCAYRDETLEDMPLIKGRPFLRKITPAIIMLEDCLEYYSNKD